MKKYILLLILAVMLNEPSFGQITQESFEKAVDILNCKTVELTLKDEETKTRFKEECPCNSTSYTKLSQFLKTTDLSVTAELSNEIESLKKEFKDNFSKDTVIKFLSDNIFNDRTKYQKIYSFAEKRKDKPEFEGYKESLFTAITAYLEESLAQQVTSKFENQQTEIENRILELEKNQRTNEKKLGILGSLSDYLVILAFALGILSLLLALRKKDNYEEILTRILDSKRLETFIHSQINLSKSVAIRSNSTTPELRDMAERIRDLEKLINRLNKDIENLKQTKSTYPSSSPVSKHEVRQPETKTEILFLSTPNSDGSFNESSASSIYKDGASIYRLIQTSISNAYFQIDEKETSIKLALQYPDKNIDPVCDAENAFNPRSKRISTIKKGEAELQNGKWVINSKAVIRYED